ncbi:PEP-CTERM sorting domain-containing protein [Plasticicumulans lactativorans]|uniref:PEP-CTERM sorting domain-containing protein n=1 Tax=Plasticicumulans lactativorans TaxID=1133106 RepID=UPI00104CB40D|nr:PEP-CTERM sorting domain-containing protein [Plasticicumulans lactativorans]
MYWNVFNIEGESALSAQIVTYAGLNDMLTDTNRLGVFTPNPGGFGTNIVDSGSDGTTYWNVFNIEGESALSAQIVTYAGLNDMLTDTNRLGVFTPNPGGFGTNIVGSGSDVLPDDVPVAVPEPAGFASFGLGLAAMPFWLRRCRRGDAATRGDVARVPA